MERIASWAKKVPRFYRFLTKIWPNIYTVIILCICRSETRFTTLLMLTMNHGAQDTSIRNSKNHFVDCSELVPTVDEFLALPFINGKTIKDVFSHATFYASLKNEKSE